MAKRKDVEDTPANKQLREGFWRMLLRIHYGIPGFKGTGFVHADGTQFTGGNAGIKTAWTLKASGQTMSMIDAVAVGGFYLFGRFWVEMLHHAGLPGNMSTIVTALDREFGVVPEHELRRGTEPVPPQEPPQRGIFTLGAARAGGMAPGVQFEVPVHGARFKVVYTRHFVDRFHFDEGERLAVSRFMGREAVDAAIIRALPRVFEVLEFDPEAEGIIVSQEDGLSMKFFAIPIPGGWQLNMVTMIAAAPLRRVSDREIEISLSPTVRIRFGEDVPEILQDAVAADLGPLFHGLKEGQMQALEGEVSRALVELTPEVVEVLEASWTAQDVAGVLEAR